MATKKAITSANPIAKVRVMNGMNFLGYIPASYGKQLLLSDSARFADWKEEGKPAIRVHEVTKETLVGEGYQLQLKPGYMLVPTGY